MSKPKTNPRRYSRTSQQSSETEKTRESILRHATREFSVRGFDGGRVDKIAARCKLSKNTLYYHFSSKDGLITAVLEEMYRQLRHSQEDHTVDASDPADALCQIVEHTFKAFTDRPEIIRLLNEENLHKARHLKHSKWLRDLYDPLVDKISAVLQKGIADGIFRESLDAVSIYLTISSMCYHFNSNASTLEMALAREFSSAKAKDDWVAHVSDVVLHYCQRGEQSEPRRQRADRGSHAA
jgi:TetR/AcrR family transcriptional regulator